MLFIFRGPERREAGKSQAPGYAIDAIRNKGESLILDGVLGDTLEMMS